MQLRRTLLAFCALASFAGATAAQTYPTRPITIVVGSSPGSATDGLARAVGNEVTRLTGQAVVVENRAGAMGGIAAQTVARAKPDGYTLFMTTNTTQAANPHLMKTLPYDPIKDFTPITLLTKGYQLLVVNPKVKANNVAELVALAKKEPGKLAYGSGSSSARVAAELFQQMTGTEMNHVPYKANPPAVVDLVAGQTDLMIVDLPASLPHVRSGKLRALGISGPKPSPLFPNVPPIAASLPGYEAGYWNALYAPANTPQPVVQRIGQIVHQALAAQSVRQVVEQSGQEIALSSAEELGRFQLAELDRWGKIIRTAGIEQE
ncbi:tripartite tricarboxylate transporter substrate binding protein [Cupriavidus sp. AU9028]|uniref:Bug family tripartite tricarboxylate transporter substrate binding protein n=1 Tax=Cupriavidus sp. AU9028 TaxID=2871157 RepID=UPI001C97100D|nr:tripartite tricarboxylate transporter substrate binding protein [Cupriavidus sp. AU9028]MBY4896736.1 tripartite tricarboxylate transporter substrate binding protein [Cupriavidus sp. AU9028]